MPPKKTITIEVPALPEPTAPAPPLFPGFASATFPAATTFRTVTLDGGGAYSGLWLAPEPIPQTLDYATVSYDLSDRAAGLYTWRHR